MKGVEACFDKTMFVRFSFGYCFLCHIGDIALLETVTTIR